MILKKIFPAVVIGFLAICLFCSPLAAQGLAGSFTTNISLKPQTTASEAGLFDFDFESGLRLSIDMSGVSFHSDLGFGITGPEFWGLQTLIAPSVLVIDDRFVFAAPFNKHGQALFSRASGAPSLLFVEKRAELEMAIAGFEFDNLFIFEDVNFPDPSSSVQTQAYTPDDQRFQFGSILSFRGITPGGISVTGVIGACADPQRYNRIKKGHLKGRLVSMRAFKDLWRSSS